MMQLIKDSNLINNRLFTVFAYNMICASYGISDTDDDTDIDSCINIRCIAGKLSTRTSAQTQ